MTRILHNPRCSKSRGALALLRERGEEPEIRLYLKEPLGVEELRELCAALGVAPQEIVRPREKRLAELGVAVSDPLGSDEWLRILAENPVLLERPIVVRGDRAVIGRPPERVLDLFDDA
mgnify:FL=1